MLGFQTVGLAGGLTTRITIVVMLAGVWRLHRKGAWRLLFLLLLAAANLVFYAVMLPFLGHAGRYQAMALLLMSPLFALGLLECVGQLLARTAPRWQVSAASAVASLAALLALSSLPAWPRITDEGIRHINATHVRMGRWLARNLPAGEPVASLDIGGITYFSHAPVIDLGGLTDSAFLPYLYSGRVAAHLRQKGIRWVVLPDGQESSQPRGDGDGTCPDGGRLVGLCSNETLTLHATVTFSSPWESWHASWAATSAAMRRQTLYEVQWH